MKLVLLLLLQLLLLLLVGSAHPICKLSADGLDMPKSIPYWAGFGLYLNTKLIVHVAMPAQGWRLTYRQGCKWIFDSVEVPTC